MRAQLTLIACLAVVLSIQGCGDTTSTVNADGGGINNPTDTNGGGSVDATPGSPAGTPCEENRDCEVSSALIAEGPECCTV